VLFDILPLAEFPDRHAGERGTQMSGASLAVIREER
jgi:hypothetical protein